jgi:hypothetical protein
MDPEILALIIPVLALLIPIIAIWTTHQRKLEEIRAKALGEVSNQAAARAAALEERVRTLEAIVTDRGYDIASQIEALRVSDATAPHTTRSTKQ